VSGVSISFFDTSALVPLLFTRHKSHAAAIACFSRIPREQRACGLHSLAEIYNFATKLGNPDRATPDQALSMLQSVRSNLNIVRPTTDDYFEAVVQLTKLNLGGPLIYDALLLQAARKVNADTIYTCDLKHFHELAPDLASRIRTP
jgi:predicted nucleic acid-binding protein